MINVSFHLTKINFDKLRRQSSYTGEGLKSKELRIYSLRDCFLIVRLTFSFILK